MTEYPDGRSLGNYAQAIWATAKRGREAARQGDPDAGAYVDVLSRIPSGPGPLSLHKVALNAAMGINKMLNGMPTHRDGGSAS